MKNHYIRHLYCLPIALILFGCNTDQADQAGQVKSSSPIQQRYSAPNERLMIPNSPDSIEIEAMGEITENNPDSLELDQIELDSEQTSKEELSSRSFALASASYTPACTQLNLNTLYDLTPTAGSYYCIYFEISTLARTEFVALGQTAGRQVNLEVFQDVNANQTFTLLGSSSDTDSRDSVLVLTEPGHYYMQLYANSGDGLPIQLAVAANSSLLDAYEPNDNVLNARVLSEARNRVVANLDVPSDIDYYRFVSENGADVEAKLVDHFDTNEWKLELLNGSSWTELAVETPWKLSGLSAGSVLNFRVSQRPNVNHNLNPYDLNIGYRIASIDQVSAISNENIVRITAQYQDDPYLTTQVHNRLDWTARIKDSKGTPLPGVEVQFLYGAQDIDGGTSSEITNSSGVASGIVAFPDCQGGHEVVHYESFGQMKGWWRSDFYYGAWRMRVPDSIGDDEVGVSDVVMGHICFQEYLPDRDDDQVPDIADQCPRTPESEKYLVDSFGCSPSQYGLGKF